MDTRAKVLTSAEATATAKRLRSEGKLLKMVSGCFDPLVAEHARRLESLRDARAALMVAIVDSPRPILPATARAELVAALQVVDYVVVPEGGDLAELPSRLGASEVVHGEAADLELTRKLVRHVHTRQRTS